jgi:nitroreductase
MKGVEDPMDVMDAITERRSVRSYQTDPISEQVLRRLVEAGIWAPSGGNAQTWRFVVVTDPQRIRRIRMLSPGLLGNSPAVIAVCQDVAEAERRGAKLGREVMTFMDTAMAAQNIMLAAYAEGLGTCAVCSFHPGGVQKLLQLPDEIVPQLLISVGVPQSVPKPPKRNFDVVWFEEYT